MARPIWFVNFIKRIYPARFMVARSSHLPLMGKFIDTLLFKGDDIIYLPKDRVMVQENVTQLGGMALPSQVVRHFIESASHRWVMNNCICRQSAHCRDYPQDLGCIFLGEAVQGINSALGRLVDKYEALDHLVRCAEAGLVHMIGRNKLDTVWMGIGPGHKLMTICNCCPCCCLFRVLPDLDPKISSKISATPGIKVVVLTEHCTGCGKCAAKGVCFTKAISLVDGKSSISVDCRTCGRCVEICPSHAIKLVVEDSRFIEKTIARLSLKVDLT